MASFLAGIFIGFVLGVSVCCAIGAWLANHDEAE